MKIIFKESFIRRLENQVEYIALDSPVRARIIYSHEDNLYRRSQVWRTESVKE